MKYLIKSEIQTCAYLHHYACIFYTYKVIKTHVESSSYTIDLPPGSNTFPTYYAAELKLHVPNDASLFPSQVHSRPGPVLTPDGLQEHKIILDA